MEVTRQRNVPTIVSANVFYLVAMLLLVTFGIAVQRWSAVWGLVITELVVILLPALAFLHLQHLPVRETLRLRWPGWDLALLSLLIGAGLWFFAATLEGFMTQLLPYLTEGGAQTSAMSPLDAAGTLLGLGLLAPLCEEVLFRGVIQRAYERRGPVQAVLIGGLLFALYHLRLQGLPAILPIALVLGYAFWRSQSLIVPIFIHLGNNMLGATSSVLQGLIPDFDITPIFLGGVLPALLVGGLALWLFHRRTRDVARVLPPPPAVGPAWRRVPLVIAIGIYLVFAGLELVYGRFPGLLAQEELPLVSAPWSETMQWQYDLTLQVTGERVGGAVCEVVPAEASASTGGEITFSCQIEQSAFEVRQGQSLWIGGDVVQTTTARWSPETLQLEAAQLLIEMPERTYTFDIVRVDGELVLVSGEGDTLTLPHDVLLVGGNLAVLAGEAPWRLSALVFEVGLASRVTLVEPLRWQPELDRAAPAVLEAVVTVTGPEPVVLPGGSVDAWRVRLDETRTAWYAITPPYPLVRYDSGILRWVLADASLF